MKKIILISIAAAAALFAASCVKEPVSDSVAKVPVTLTVGMDNAITKTVLGGDLKISWDGTESIGVFDGIATTPNKFDATSAGATTSFSGTISQGAENFIVFYPYQAEAVVSDKSTATIKVRMPAVQNAIKNSFDPAAGLAAIQATSLSGALTLKNQFSLLKVNVDQDGVTSIAVSATNRKMAGGISLKVSTNGGSNGDAPTSNSVTLKNADDSALEQGIYYIAVRPSSTTSAYEGFKMEVVKNGVTKTRSAGNNLVIARSHVVSFGKVSDLFDDGGQTPPTPSGRYEAYMAGEDVVIGGKTYNKATDGDAVLLDPEQNITDSKMTAKVHFLKSGENYTASGLAISKEIVIATTDPSIRSKITPYNSGSTWKLNSGSLLLDGIIIDMSPFESSGSTVTFFTNSGATADFDSLVLSNCAMGAVENEKPMYLFSVNSGKAGYAITNIKIIDCLIRTGGKLQALINPTSNSTAAQNFKSLEFTNNVLYSSTGSNVRVQIFTFGGTKSSSTTSDWVMNLKINNNLFYNVATSSGWFKSFNIGSVEVKNNVLFAVDGTDAGGNAKILALSDKNGTSNYSANTICNDNYYFGTLSGSWTIADNTYRVGNLVNPSPATVNPIKASTDVATGKFVLTAAYSAYGPQPMPIPM